LNTKKNFSEDKPISFLVFASEMYRLGTEIDDFVKADIAKLKNKLG
jgi:hypothetical protein